MSELFFGCYWMRAAVSNRCVFCDILERQVRPVEMLTLDFAPELFSLNVLLTNLVVFCCVSESRHYLI